MTPLGWEPRRRMVEREREKAGWRNWSEVQIAVAGRAGWWESKGPFNMCHMAQRGEETGNPN